MTGEEAHWAGLGPGELEPMDWKPSPELEAMMEMAWAQKLLFHSDYHNPWFAPEELAREWANGSFRWGAENWKLVPRADYVLELARQRDQLYKKVEEIVARIRKIQEE